MISKNEQLLLDDLEQRLADQDPQLASRLATMSTPADFPLLTVVVALFVAGAPLAHLVFGFPGLVIASDAFAAAVVFALLRRRLC